MEMQLLPPGHLAGQADSDEQVIKLWLHGRSPHTQRAYGADAIRFLAFVEQPIPQVKLGDLQAFADSLKGQPSSRGRTIAAIKSLLTFASKIGYAPFNVGAAMPVPGFKNSLAERILVESAVLGMIRGEWNVHNRVLLRLLYVAGLRVSEACSLCWRDLQSADDAGQLNVFGKGQRTRVILLTASLWEGLQALRGLAGADDPVFRSRHGVALDPRQVRRIVLKAAKRAGIEAPVSPHWFRHAHASHALDRGAPIHLVQATLGHSSVATTGRYLHARPKDSSARFLAE